MNQANNSLTETIEIDLSQIDWNKLSPEEFRSINEKLIANQKLIKKQERKQSRNVGTVTVIIHNKPYQVKATDYQRLKSMRSEKSRQKLIDKIILENPQIEEI